MRATKILFVAMVMALGLGLPATVAAQSAGDDQYADPFVQKEDTTQPAAPAQDQSAPNNSVSAPATNTAAAAAAPDDAGAKQLPYTGLNLVLLLVTGSVLLLSGFTVRRVLTGPYTAAR